MNLPYWRGRSPETQKYPAPFARTRVCLDVLEERGLIRLERGSRALCIQLTPGPGKVDLERSAILLRLRNQKEGDA